MYGPANKQGHSYHYESSLVYTLGPCHPHSAKSALFCVTMAGTLKMYWSQNNNRMEETAMELESVNASDELVTHAAFSSDKSRRPSHPLQRVEIPTLTSPRIPACCHCNIFQPTATPENRDSVGGSWVIVGKERIASKCPIKPSNC